MKRRGLSKSYLSQDHTSAVVAQTASLLAEALMGTRLADESLRGTEVDKIVTAMEDICLQMLCPPCTWPLPNGSRFTGTPCGPGLDRIAEVLNMILLEMPGDGGAFALSASSLSRQKRAAEAFRG